MAPFPHHSLHSRCRMATTMAQAMTKRRQQSFLLQVLSSSSSSSTSSCSTSPLRISAASLSTSALRRAANPSPTELTSSVQESKTSQEQEQHHQGLSAGPSTRSGTLAPYQQWRKTQGKAFERTPIGKGPFWLSDTPFPLNPSFDPPPPVANSVRQEMWRLHRANPQINSVRVLSGKFGITMERVVPILRLMALETEMRREGLPIQDVFQRSMENLLGSDPKYHLAKREEAPLAKGNEGDVRGEVFEELGPGGEEDGGPSALSDAFAREAVERRERIRNLRTGGPALTGSEVTETSCPIVRKGSEFASIKFVDLSNRKESYLGASKLRQNQKRALQRQQNKTRRRERDPQWMRRYELAERIQQGDRSPELIEEKKQLDEQRRQEVAAELAERKTKYKSNKKYKKAMKLIRDQRSIDNQKLYTESRASQ